MKRYIVEFRYPKWVVLDTKTQRAVLLVSDKRFAQGECKRLNDNKSVLVTAQIF
ncbi:hypothetical protein [Chitinibacter sp. S2-10]|uniref:hypothetical protein n=1 Tax=Chitinibacter sp. S2-10 TaxID=3373597 RepID=UPI00397776B6